MNFIKLLKNSFLPLFLILIFLNSCSKDDDNDPEEEPVSEFYQNALITAKNVEILGTWAIFNAEYAGEVVQIPINFDVCGRDYFTYTEGGIYEEYLYTDSSCNTQKNELKWKLQDGIITFSNFGLSDELVITKLNSTSFSFKAQVGVDEDGELDVITLNAKKYSPKDLDNYSNTFQRVIQDHENEIYFLWQPYDGSKTFVNYEIYRSEGDCGTNAAKKIATITDVEASFFNDREPPAAETLCYFLRINTSEGLLGESQGYSIITKDINVAPIALEKPSVVNEEVHLNWEAYDGPFFSHYEIYVSNFQTNVTGGGHQNIPVTEIYDQQITSFVDDNPPYFANPVYIIRAHTIFGGVGYINSDEATSGWEVDFRRKEVLSLSRIENFAIDPELPIVYFLGSTTQDYRFSLQKFNYATNRIEAISTGEFRGGFSVKFVNTQTNGKEIVSSNGNELFLYDANNLEYKYALKLNSYYDIIDYEYLGNQLWALIDGFDLHMYKRDNGNFVFVEKKPLFDSSVSFSGYKIAALKNNQILVGHFEKSKSLLFTINAEGHFDALAKRVDIPLFSNITDRIIYNPEGDFILNSKQNSVFSTQNFSFLSSFEMPYFPYSVSDNGNLVFGSNNDPDWIINDESLHKKEAVILNRSTLGLQKLETIGYPLYLFENYDGKLMSISSGLKRESFNGFEDHPSFFFEEINLN